jgi:hypothetical protein
VAKRGSLIGEHNVPLSGAIPSDRLAQEMVEMGGEINVVDRARGEHGKCNKTGSSRAFRGGF